VLLDKLNTQAYGIIRINVKKTKVM